MALAFDRRRAHRVLVLPAWFDEANKLRRQTVETMRRLDASGIDAVLPDFPGCNESEAPLFHQTLEGWRGAAEAAAKHFRATHVLAVRAGVMLAPEGLPGWAWAPTGGRLTLRGMMRARTIAAKEAGRAERTEDLQATGRSEGIELAGWHIGPTLFAALETTEPAGELEEIEQASLGGSALWLRAEPAEDAKQADALAALIAAALPEMAADTP
nr:hypothetical protein [Tsuneonella amylolytica]